MRCFSKVVNSFISRVRARSSNGLKRSFRLAALTLIVVLVVDARELCVRLFSTFISLPDIPKDACHLLKSVNLVHEHNLLAFTHSGAVKDWQLVSLFFARYFNPGVCLLVLTDNSSLTFNVVVQYLQVSVIPVVREAHTAYAQNTREAKFSQNYRHSSSNDPKFELACFRRFLELDAFISTLAPDLRLSITHVDLDLVLFSSTASQIPNLYLWAPNRYATYFVRFSRAALHDFAEFLSSLYESDSLSLVNVIDKYGAKTSNMRALGPPSWIPKNSSHVPRQFSDMYAFRAWTETINTGLEPVVLLNRDADLSSARPSEIALIHLRNALQNRSVCDPNSDLIDTLKWYTGHFSRHSRLKLPMFRTEGNIYEPVLGVHFQGKCKNYLCAVMCPLLDKLDGNMISCCKSSAQGEFQVVGKGI